MQLSFSLQEVACEVTWKLFGQRVRSGQERPSPAVELGAASAGAVKALQSLGISSTEAWLCGALQG